ncbi:MAG TPA: hypothetical protein VF062_19515 [Candidatus Limnocylindrales bacterium]
MTNDLDRIAQPTPAVISSEATAVEQARAVAEVAAAVKVAQQFPRDIARALGQMREACKQKSLADRAFYSLPRAGGRVEGSTVHLAREIGRCWGNLDYGVRELRRDDDAGVSEMQAWAWDQENNVRSSRSFVVPHARMVGSAKRGDKRRERLDDLADIANNNNSVAARAVRESVFAVLPVWFREEAEQIAAATLNGAESGKTIDQQIADAVSHFGDAFGVTVKQLETRLDRKRADWTGQDLGVLRVIASEISRGEKTVEQQFPAASDAVTAEEITGGTQ